MSRIIKSSRVNLLAQDTRVNETLNESTEDKSQNLQQDLNKENEYEKIIDIAKKRAEDIVNEAIAEAGSIKENVIKDAEEELKRIKTQAYNEGYGEGKNEGYSKGYEIGHGEGFQNGFDEGKSESNTLIEQANSIKREYLEEKAKTLNSIESDVINLVLSIVEKVLNQKVEDDETIINLVLKGLESLNNKDDIRIRISKEDFEKVNRSREEILSKVSLIENLKIDIDSNLKKGDCFIESSKGNVDVSIDTQIKNVEQELKDLLDSE